MGRPTFGRSEEERGLDQFDTPADRTAAVVRPMNHCWTV